MRYRVPGITRRFTVYRMYRRRADAIRESVRFRNRGFNTKIVKNKNSYSLYVRSRD